MEKEYFQENHFGKLSRCNLLLEEKEGKTYLSHVDFTAPFKVMRPFYDKNNQFSIMIMNSSAGIMAGDRQELSIHVNEKAKGKVFSQSYEKIHKTQSGYGERSTHIHIDSQGFLHYTPLPTIPFAGSSFQNHTKIHLKDESAQFIFGEIFTCGRVAMGEKFQFTSFESSISVFTGETLVFSDRTKYKPKKQNLENMIHFQHYTHQGFLFLCHFSLKKEKLEQLNKYYETTETVLVRQSTTAFGDLIIRFLGTSGEQLENIQKNILNILELDRLCLSTPNLIKYQSKS